MIDILKEINVVHNYMKQNYSLGKEREANFTITEDKYCIESINNNHMSVTYRTDTNGLDILNSRVLN